MLACKNGFGKIINKQKRHLYDCGKTLKFAIVQNHISIPQSAIVIKEVQCNARLQGVDRRPSFPTIGTLYGI